MIRLRADCVQRDEPDRPANVPVSVADTSAFPTTARVVIVGGGIMGCGLAYHLVRLGWSEVVLLEKAELTSGSTWHAAGQITHSTSSPGLGNVVDYNIGLYSGALERDTGCAVSWHGCGSLRLAYDEDGMDWLRHTLSVGRALGFDIDLVGCAEIARRHPFYRLDGVRGALYTPRDGHVDPSGVTLALAAGARQRGARIIRRCRATGITSSAGGEWVVDTTRGAIRCEHVVNAGGAYARQVGEWSQLQLPMVSMTHHYLVTEAVPEFDALDCELPVVRDDLQVSGYIRMEQNKGLIGIYEKTNPNAVWEDGCPWEAEHELFAADYERILPWLENALWRMPVLAQRGISRVVHGAISHPPDGNPLIGPAPGVRNYWCCCGTQIGIGWGPGLTRELANWMVLGAADISMREYDPRRFGAYADKTWQAVKAKEDYCLRHEIPFPHFNRLAGRPLKPSPLYATLRHKGAVFEEVYGHERPRWFAGAGMAAADCYSFRRNAVHERVVAEVKAVRTAAGIMDISAFAKIEVCGAGAAAWLGRLVANRLPGKTGGIVLTHLLNRRGRIELEATVVKLAEGRYYLVCAAFFEQRLLDHLAAAGQDDAALARMRLENPVAVINRSDAWAALALNGPNARAILAQCTPAALALARFRWLSAQQIELAGHRLWALRLSYCGESGWEFHGPRGAIAAAYPALWAAGEGLGLADYGSFAMNAMRLEKGFKGAAELTNEVTLPEADVMRFVRLDKVYRGGEQTAAGARGVLPWVCAYLEIEPDGVSDGHGGEAVLCAGAVVGATTSVAFGPTVGKILAFAYLEPAAAKAGTGLEVMIAGQARKACVLAQPAYDPRGELPRGDG